MDPGSARKHPPSPLRRRESTRGYAGLLRRSPSPRGRAAAQIRPRNPRTPSKRGRIALLNHAAFSPTCPWALQLRTLEPRECLQTTVPTPLPRRPARAPGAEPANRPSPTARPKRTPRHPAIGPTPTGHRLPVGMRARGSARGRAGRRRLCRGLRRWDAGLIPFGQCAPGCGLVQNCPGAGPLDSLTSGRSRAGRTSGAQHTAGTDQKQAGSKRVVLQRCSAPWRDLPLDGHHLATSARLAQMPQQATLEGLARGLGVPVAPIHRAAAEAAGVHVYFENPPEIADPEVEILIASVTNSAPPTAGTSPSSSNPAPRRRTLTSPLLLFFRLLFRSCSQRRGRLSNRPNAVVLRVCGKPDGAGTSRPRA